VPPAAWWPLDALPIPYLVVHALWQTILDVLYFSSLYFTLPILTITTRCICAQSWLDIKKGAIRKHATGMSPLRFIRQNLG